MITNNTVEKNVWRWRCKKFRIIGKLICKLVMISTNEYFRNMHHFGKLLSNCLDDPDISRAASSHPLLSKFRQYALHSWQSACRVYFLYQPIYRCSSI